MSCYNPKIYERPDVSFQLCDIIIISTTEKLQQFSLIRTKTLKIALSIFARTQQRFSIVVIRRLIKMTPTSSLHKTGNHFPFYKIYNRIRHLRQKVVVSIFVGISAQTLFLI